MADKRKIKKRKDDQTDPAYEKPSKQEYVVAKWLKANVPTKKTKFINHSVEYFTGAKAVDALMESNFALGKNPLFTTRPECLQFCHEMLLHKFFHRAKKVPVSEQELKSKKTKVIKSAEDKDDKNQLSEGNEKEKKEKSKEKTKKRKIRLEMHLEQLFLDTTDAYVWIYDPMPWYYWVCGALVVFATIAICMFPLWPPIVRRGVYHLSVGAAGFLVFLLTLAVVRVLLFCIIWAVTFSRHHLWLLPNLTEDVGFLASFWPLYQYEYKGPGLDADDSPKSKKKRKKDKLSDDEADEKLTVTIVHESPELDEPPPTASEEPEEEQKPSKESGSESENSQRSSTDRDFEIVDRDDLDEDEHRPLVEQKSS